MSDLQPFRHGEEGTHAICNKHNIGGKSVCCECSGRTDCSDTAASSEGGWEERIDLLWSRAHIPEYADDAKTVIEALIHRTIAADRKEREGELRKAIMDMEARGTSREERTFYRAALADVLKLLGDDRGT